VPNFIGIRWDVAELWWFNGFSKSADCHVASFQSRHLNYGTVQRVTVHHRAKFVAIVQAVAQIWQFLDFWKWCLSTILDFTKSKFYQPIGLSRSKCVILPNFTAICRTQSMWAEWDSEPKTEHGRPKIELVSWSLTSLFSTNMAILEMTENWVSGDGAVSRCARKPWSGSEVRSGRVTKRERSGERTKLAAQILLKGFWKQYKTTHICSRVPEMVVPVKPHYV